METFYILLGSSMIVSWVWSIIIVFKKTKEALAYEKAILIVGLVTAILYFIGSSA